MNKKVDFIEDLFEKLSETEKVQIHNDYCTNHVSHYSDVIWPNDAETMDELFNGNVMDAVAAVASGIILRQTNG